MPTFSWRLVTFDIDGTLTVGHGWRFLAEQTGQLARYSETNDAFFAGREGEDVHLKKLLELAVGLPLTRVEQILEATPKVRGIRETVDALHARGAKAGLLSHNPGYVCAWYARRFGFDDWEGTEAPVVDGVVAPLGEVRADKRRGMERLLERLSVPARATCHVGDGTADGAVFPQVGLGIAVNTGLVELLALADVSLTLDDLTAVLPVLESRGPRDG